MRRQFFFLSSQLPWSHSGPSGHCYLVAIMRYKLSRLFGSVFIRRNGSGCSRNKDPKLFARYNGVIVLESPILASHFRRCVTRYTFLLLEHSLLHTDRRSSVSDAVTFFGQIVLRSLILRDFGWLIRTPLALNSHSLSSTKKPYC